MSEGKFRSINLLFDNNRSRVETRRMKNISHWNEAELDKQASIALIVKLVSLSFDWTNIDAIHRHNFIVGPQRHRRMKLKLLPANLAVCPKRTQLCLRLKLHVAALSVLTAALLPLPKTWKNPFEADNLIHSLSERWKSLHHCEVSKRFVYETVSSICGIQSSVCVGKSLMKNAPTLHSLRGGTSTCEDTEKRERRTRRMLERNKCKVNEPRAKRKHRRFTIMTSKLVSLSLTLCVNFTA